MQCLISIKYPKQITLCDTNTVILLIIVIIIDIQFLPISKKIKWDDQLPKILISGIPSLKFWSEKIIAGIAILMECGNHLEEIANFLNCGVQ